MTDGERVALVTGASSGLGRAIAQALDREGWVVGLLARRRERLETLASELQHGLVLAGDLRDSSFAERALAELVGHTGRLDLLVNNAGAPTGPHEVATDEQFDRAFTLNVRAIYRLSHLALPHLQASRGSIVNVSSAGVARTVPLDLVYLASKGAVEVLSRGLAKKWAPLGVRVNTVAPGIVPTEILTVAGFVGDEAAEQVRWARETFQPLPHEGRAEEVAEAVLYLASEGARFVTGALLHVDGGMALGG
jgi:NAD(P)-dependent dehydrogenase (short-subunit alcohol dehydrogenase family)